jgi:hypothetical protein
MSKQQLIDLLQEQIPENAVIEIRGEIQEPKSPTFNMGDGNRPTSIISSIELTDKYELFVKYTV